LAVSPNMSAAEPIKILILKALSLNAPDLISHVKYGGNKQSFSSPRVANSEGKLFKMQGLPRSQLWLRQEEVTPPAPKILKLQPRYSY
jgi:hypothetical protein